MPHARLGRRVAHPKRLANRNSPTTKIEFVILKGAALDNINRVIEAISDEYSVTQKKPATLWSPDIPSIF